MEQIEKTSIIIDEKIGFVTISNTNGETKSSSIFSAQEEKKDKFKRLDIKGICKDIAGKGIASRNLYRKINPAVIQAIQNNPDLIKGYISSIYNKEELPFELTHNLEGLNLFEKLKLRKYTKAEQKSGALIKGKKFNRNKALTSGRKYNTKDEQESQELHELQELSNNIDEDLYDIENFFKGWDEKQFKEQFNVENSEGSIEKQAAKSASEKENIGNGSKEELGK